MYDPTGTSGCMNAVELPQIASADPANAVRVDPASSSHTQVSIAVLPAPIT
jgi:hypothetical protein